MPVTIKLRRDTAANWTSANPVLNQGEPGLETDTGKLKVGDGSTAWTSLAYSAAELPLPASLGGTGATSQNWQGLLTPTTQTTTYTATAGQLVKANISSSSWTLTLPNAPAANTVIGAKVIAQATGTQNTLTVACAGSDKFETSTGGTTTTLTMPSQAAAWQYNGGYWTRVSDDLPLTQLDSRYTHVFSPVAYGGVGNGTTDDTAAVQAAFTAAAAVNGTVFIGNLEFLTSSAISLPSGITVAGGAVQGASLSKGSIVNNTSDVFTCTAVTNVLFQNVSITASAGHIFDLSSSGTMSSSVFRGCSFNQYATNKGVFYGSGSSVAFIANFVGEGTVISQQATATVSAVTLITSGSQINGNTFSKVELVSGAATTAGVPFFHIEAQGGSYSYDNTFRDILGEQCYTGLITLLSAAYCEIDTCTVYDTTTFYNSLITIDTSSVGGSYSSQQITISNSGRRGGSLQSGCYDVYAPNATVTLNNCGPASGAASNSLNANSTVINSNYAYGAPKISGLVIPNPLGLSTPCNFYPWSSWASNAFAGANYIIVTQLTSGGVSVSNIGYYVGVASGHANFGVWANNGGVPGTLYATSGSVSITATGNQSTAFGSSFTPDAGDWVGVWADNTTITFYGATNAFSTFGTHLHIVGAVNSSTFASSPTVSAWGAYATPFVILY